MNPVLLRTAVAPLIWGSTYLITTRFLSSLPAPLLGTLRILPAGLLLLAVVRTLPPPGWWGRMVILALLRQALFFTLLYAAALHLPGGVAATIGGSTAMLVILMAYPLLGQRPSSWHFMLALTGLLGVGLISLTAKVALSPIGLLYAVGFASVNALGVTLFKRWGPPPGSTPVKQAAWELTLGGLMQLPLGLGGSAGLAHLPLEGWLALTFLTLVGTAFAAILWQRGLNELPVQLVSLLGPLSPLTALTLDLVVVHKTLSAWQALGALIILGSVLLAALPPRRG